MENAEIVSTRFTYSDTLKRIDVYMMGEPLSEDTRDNLKARMPDYGLEDCTLKLHQGGTSQAEYGRMTQEVKVGIIEEMYRKNERAIRQKDSALAQLQMQLLFLQGDTIPFSTIEQELRVQYPALSGFSYAKSIQSEFSGAPDTIPTFVLNWNPKTSTSERALEAGKIERWLRIRLRDDRIAVISY